MLPREVERKPEAPRVSSPTHSDPERWYATSTAVFSWQLPGGVSEVQLLVDKLPESIPTTSYRPPISQKIVKDVDDGTWYFHIRFRSIYGFGETSHFRFRIDTKSPEPFSIIFPDGTETTNPQPVINFAATDTLSGISHYVLKIGDGDFFTLPKDVEHNPYRLPLQAPGQRTMLVRALDRADNFTDASAEFTVLAPLRPSPMPQLQTIYLLIIVGLLAVLGWRWYRSFLFKNYLLQEVRGAEGALHKAFDLLKEDIEEQIEMLEKAKTVRELTREEKKIVKQLKENLDTAEKYIKKEIQDIEREIKYKKL